MSRNKNKNKKKKIAGQNLSLSERLARNWENDRWEAFVSLYMRDREVSDRGPWAERFPDALYNCLTSALFQHRNRESARPIAEMILSEHSLGQDGDIIRMCARTALDFMNIRDGKALVPSDGEGFNKELPAPYGELRRRLVDCFVQGKPGKRGRATSNSAVEKLSKQFKALPSAKNSGPYSSFLKTAEVLAEENKLADAAEIFKAVRYIAMVMREVSRSGSKAMNPNYVTPIWDSKEYPSSVSHPVLFTLWEHMCRLGGRKFGGDWERAARVARMSLFVSDEEFKPAYDKLMALDDEDFQEERFPIIAERYYSGWTEHERFILIFLAISEIIRDGIIPFVNIPFKMLLRWFKTLGEIGRRWRSGGAWPIVIRRSFERLIMFQDGKFADLLAKEDLPFESMTAPTIIVMVLCGPHILMRVKDKLGPRLPLRVDKRDEEILDEFFSDIVFPLQALKVTSELFDRSGRESFYKVIIMSIIRKEVSLALERERYAPTLWNSISQAHLAMFAENLAEGSRLAIFCQLCVGQKHMGLSDDPAKIAAFFSSRPDEDLSNAFSLSLFLMNWPGISFEFLLKLFEDSISGHERADELETIPKVISKIVDPESRKRIAHGVLIILKRRFKGRSEMSQNLKSVIKSLDTLRKGGKLSGNHEKEYSGFEGGELIKIFERMFKGK
ncbi:MAG: hypothetical protein LBI74_09240 [Synergistaceae bacterium]|nr:hypothetical protein [Synergistaceae bacterium]